MRPYGYPLSKGVPRRILKARRQRAERQVIIAVRRKVYERDGFCRLGDETCQGVSEWAHLAGFKRFQTRGQEPTERHQTAHTMMLCGAHHHAYDAHQFEIEYLSEDGADGPIRVVVR